MSPEASQVQPAGPLSCVQEVVMDELIADVLHWLHGIERDHSQEDYVLIA